MHRAVGALRLWTVVSDCLVVSHVWFRALTEYGSNCAAPAPVVCLVSSTPASLGPGSPPVFSDSEPWLHIRFTQEAFEMPSEALPPTMEPRVVAWGCSVGPQVLVRAEKHLLMPLSCAADPVPRLGDLHLCRKTVLWADWGKISFPDFWVPYVYHTRDFLKSWVSFF